MEKPTLESVDGRADLLVLFMSGGGSRAPPPPSSSSKMALGAPTTCCTGCPICWYVAICCGC